MTDADNITALLQGLHERLTAQEVALQLFAQHLKEMAPEDAQRVATSMANIASTNKIEASDQVKAYLEHLSKLLTQVGFPVIGLDGSMPMDPSLWSDAFRPRR